jgi:hypothetical protein
MTTYLFLNNLLSFFSESFGIGLTTEDIVDRLLSTEYNKTGKKEKKEKRDCLVIK